MTNGERILNEILSSEASEDVVLVDSYECWVDKA